MFTGTPYQEFTLGANRNLFISGTDQHVGEWGAITALDDTSFTELVSDTMDGTIVSMVIPAGVTVFGHFTTIKMAAGSCVAYGI